MFSDTDMKARDFKISVIADVTCDINGSVPTTIRASTITQPFYGYNIVSGKEDLPFNNDTVCIMAVDNLPCELPRDASDDFGKDLMERVLPYVFGEDPDHIIRRASITKEGKLTTYFEYLSDYAY
jgi:alanine dehydrogenase